MDQIKRLQNNSKTITLFSLTSKNNKSTINRRRYHHQQQEQQNYNYRLTKNNNILMRNSITTTTNFMAFIIYLIISIQFIGILSEPITDSTTDHTLNSKTSTIVKTNSRTTKETKEFSSVPTKSYVPVTQVPKLTKRAGSLLDSKLKKTTINHSSKESITHQKQQNQEQKQLHQNQTQNRSREALSHEGSDRETVVYLSEPTGYVPVTSYRGGKRPSPHQHVIPPTGSATGTGAGYHTDSQAVEVENWRPDIWGTEYHKKPRFNNTRVQHIEAECQDDYMKIRIGFNGSFTGLLYSAGYAYDPDCMYINGSGRDYYEFYIQLNRCGTLGKNALHDDTRKNPTNFMWNTITVQYNPLIEEEFDEHFKVTCEYGYDFWKTVTFPFLDVEVATGNPVVFTLSPPECYMEIRNGYGIGGTRVTGPVRVGDPLTLIIYMRSKYDGFDIVVNDCYAHNGAQKRIQLIDEYGCPVDDKLISRFRGTWSDSGVYETQVYAYMKTFRFTGSPALYIECDVRMCHGRCPSQPCHWRNLKSVSKRSTSSNDTNLIPSPITELNDDKTISKTSQSENINLFQSLRVLQEGEEDDTELSNSYTSTRNFANETCIKTTILSALSAAISLLLCILLASLIFTCSKLRYRKKKSSGNYNSYVTHKGQID